MVLLMCIYIRVDKIPSGEWDNGSGSRRDMLTSREEHVSL